MTRALVIGSGPNGLSAAIALLKHGVEVEVREAAGHLGGGLHTEELTLPGFLHDVCATVQPLAVGSPFFRSLDLDPILQERDRRREPVRPRADHEGACHLRS